MKDVVETGGSRDFGLVRVCTSLNSDSPSAVSRYRRGIRSEV